MNEIVARIYELIAKSGISKSDLAKEIGLSKNTIQNWKKFNSMPSLSVIERICEVLNITVEQFFSGMGDDEIKRQEEEFLDEWRMLSNTEKVLIKNVMEEFKKSRS